MSTSMKWIRDRARVAVVLIILAIGLLCLALVLASADRAAAPPSRAAKITAAVREAMRQAGIPGAIVGVWQKGAAPYTNAFGVSDRASGEPMSTHLYMRIGSETKTFTGTAVLQLVDRQRIGLDDPVAKYVDGVPGGDSISIRELAAMRSGLLSYTESKAWAKRFLAEPQRHWTPRQLLRYGFAKGPLFAPGSAFSYSNTNTILLGLVVEKVSGEKLGTYIDRHILKPEQLTHTVFPAGAALPSPHAHGYTEQTPTGKFADASDWDPSWAGAAGAMISTLGDLHIWAKEVATGTLLRPKTQRQRERFIPIEKGATASYGFALFDVNGWIGHDGLVPGYETLAVYLPAAKATVVVLLNSDVNPPHEESSALLGAAITNVITPKHVFDFAAGG